MQFLHQVRKLSFSFWPDEVMNYTGTTLPGMLACLGMCWESWEVVRVYAWSKSYTAWARSGWSCAWWDIIITKSKVFSLAESAHLGVAISFWVQQTHTCVCLGAKRARREKPPFTGLLLFLNDIFNEVRVFVLFWAPETSTSHVGFWTTEQTLICSVDQAMLAATAIHHTVLTLPKGTAYMEREGGFACHLPLLRKKEIKLTKSEKCEKLTSWSEQAGTSFKVTLLYVHITLSALTLDDFSISPNASLQNSSPPSYMLAYTSVHFYQSILESYTRYLLLHTLLRPHTPFGWFPVHFLQLLYTLRSPVV